ncbi:PstS family phosphate ABC transporter substrate-binding protein [Blastopirellula retiformator]|uniref:Phosphate-binding protein PstS n=1 Tax=Blastopirellula retiformator TaxID=2527970 RepID=A0A5C5VLF0_9BACT|nr:substrate-binding domain-containing protein [Blastopirellula retiformator]TWT39456.1 Phosphate-binding protein PstS precursor [Blastopirellula retiformator]
MCRQIPLTLLCSFIATGLAWAEPIAIDPDLPHYHPVDSLSGTLRLIGSDTMNNIVHRWADGFTKIYPNVDVQIRQKGASTAVGGLLSGGADLGMSTQALRESERFKLQAKLGGPPVEIAIGANMTAIFVHRDNPIACLNMKQVDAIFSSTKKADQHDITTWSQLLPPTAPMANQPIRLYGRNSASQVYGQLKTTALLGGDFKSTIIEMPGSQSLLQAIAGDANGCGYTGIGYQTPAVRAVPIQVGETTIPPTIENLDRYPLTQKLRLIYIVPSGEKLDPLLAEFIRFVYSQEGQSGLVREGFAPLAESRAQSGRYSVCPRPQK